MQQALLKTHFRRVLDARGYNDVDDSEVEWSLGYCQGDGVAFYSKISGLTDLAKRAFPDDANKVALIEAAAEHLSVRIERNSFGHHYSHFNTMEVIEDGWLPEDVETAHQRLHLKRIEDAFTAFLKWLEEDVRDTSRLMERDGYKILEAGSPGFFSPETTECENDRQYVVAERRALGHLTAEIRVYEPCYSDNTLLDDEAVGELLDGILKGDTIYYEPAVVLLDEDEIGRSEMGVITDLSVFPSPYLGSLASELIQQALDDAGETVYVSADEDEFADAA